MVKPPGRAKDGMWRSTHWPGSCCSIVSNNVGAGMDGPTGMVLAAESRTVRTAELICCISITFTACKVGLRGSENVRSSCWSLLGILVPCMACVSEKLRG
jgi:hypothetical protein